jgi:hypothetical protein
MRSHIVLTLSIVLCALVVPEFAQRHDDHLPNSRLTPGDAFDVSTRELCAPGYSSPAEHVPVELKSRVFERYGISPEMVGYNVDHLIPVGLGGSNSLKNLWPQPIAGEWNHVKKDRLERRLVKLVCNRTITLENARREIATDWVDAYKKYFPQSRRRHKVARESHR